MSVGPLSASGLREGGRLPPPSKDISVIIPARNEHPQASFTLQLIWDELERSDFDWETILVDDQSDDLTSQYCRDRWWHGMGFHKIIVRGEGGSCWQARNEGWRAAEGRCLFFFDAHVVISRDLFQLQMEALRDAQIVFTPVRNFSDKKKNTCYGYALGPDNHHLYTKFWGSWTKGRRRETPYPTPMSGTAGMAVHRDWIESFDGWPRAMRMYGGGEQWISLLTWMLGGRCVVDPRTYLYHYNGRRAYPREGFTEAHLFNRALVAYALGGEEWLGNVRAFALDQESPHGFKGQYVEAAKGLLAQAKIAGEPYRQWVAANARYTLNEVLAAKPWEEEGDGSAGLVVQGSEVSDSGG